MSFAEESQHDRKLMLEHDLPLPFVVDGVGKVDPILKGWHWMESRTCLIRCSGYLFRCGLVDLPRQHFEILFVPFLVGS
jgi:hypothetical protein